MLGTGDYISISLVLTIIGAIVTVLRATHKARTDAAKQRQEDREADTARHHDLDKRTDRLEQQAQLAPAVSKLTALLETLLDRERDPRASGVYRKPDQ